MNRTLTTVEQLRLLWSKIVADHLRFEVLANLGISLSAKSFSLFGGLLLQFVLVRSLGVTEFGLYTLIWTVLLTLAIIGKAGYELSAIRYVAEYHAKQEWAHLVGFQKHARAMVILVSLAVIGISATALYGIFTFDWITAQTVHVCLIMLPVLPLYALTELNSGILRGMNRLTEALFTQSVLFPVGVVITMCVLPFVGFTETTAITAIVVSGVVLFIIIFVQHWQIQKRLPHQAQTVTPAYQSRVWVRVSGTMMTGSSIEQILRQLDMLAVGMLIGTTATGIYAVAVRFAKLISVGLQISNQSTAHMYSPLYNGGNLQDLQRVISWTAVVSALTTAPILLIFFLWPRQLLLVFGEEFSEQGALILQILLLGQFANALAGPNGILLVMTKYQSAMVWALLSTLLINLLLLLVLVPKWGIIGIAVATSVAVLFRNIVLCTQVKQRLQINTTIFSSHILKGVLG